MADLLASLGIHTSSEPTHSYQSGYASIEELQQELRALILDGKTPTRAAHVRNTLELRGTARVQVSGNDNDGTPDPTGMAMEAAQQTQQPGREIDVTETLRDQSTTDPTLQRSVAKQIVSAISRADESHWVPRDMSRQGSGWTFTYHCRDSLQQWQRQQAKGEERLPIGEYSQQPPDPVLNNRPAFDCRGTLTIAFPRNGRAVTAKYEHTPIHETVAQAKERLKPPPIPAPQKKVTEKTPRKSSKENGSGDPKTPKTKTPKTKKMPKAGEEGTEDAECASTMKKKKKKKRSSAATDGEGSARPKKSRKKTDGTADTTTPSTTSAAPVPTTAAVPNVSAREAARRKDVAQKLLSDNGVDPDTLSTEQFTIFSNQAPELQQESLKMLMLYGAQRLQIVHPGGEREGSQPTQQTATASAPNGDKTTTKELAPNGSGKPVGKSRLACHQCKERRTTKCSRDRPSCAACSEDGRKCTYPPQPIRDRKKEAATREKRQSAKSQEIVVEDDDDDSEALFVDANETIQPKEDVAQQNMGWVNVQQAEQEPHPPAQTSYRPTSIPGTMEPDQTNSNFSAASGLALLHDFGGTQATSANNHHPSISVGDQQVPVTALHQSPPAPPQAQPTMRRQPTKLPDGRRPSSNGQQDAFQQQFQSQPSQVQQQQQQQPASQYQLPHNSPRAIAAQQALARVSPAQQSELAARRARSQAAAQQQRSQSRTPVNNGMISTPTATQPPASSLANHPLSNSKVGSHRQSMSNADRVPYPPYAHGNSRSQDFTSTTSTAAQAPMTTTASVGYPSMITGWTTQNENTRSYNNNNASSNNTFNQQQPSNASQDFNMKGANTGRTDQPQQQHQQQRPGAYGSQQQQPQQGYQSQQTRNSWGIGGGESDGNEYNNMPHQYWS